MNDQELLKLARAAREQAYAPYSGFTIGAAVLTESGRVFTGANVENVSYGLSVCAERVAVLKAVVAGDRALTRLVVTADTEETPAPCGACLAVLAEFGPNMTVVMVGRENVREEKTLWELLPRRFDLPRAGE